MQDREGRKALIVKLQFILMALCAFMDNEFLTEGGERKDRQDHFSCFPR